MLMEKNGLFTSSIALIKSRKEVVFGVTWTTALATIIAGKGFPPITKSFLSIMALMMMSLSVYIYNDLVDREMDAYSNQEKKKRRPIANGKVSQNIASKFIIVTGLLGLGLCYMINTTVFVIGATYSIIMYLYSYPLIRFKTVYILKNVVTSIVLPMAFLIGGAAIQNTVSTTMLFLFLTFYVFMFSILPAGADCLDLVEDKAFNVKTIGGTLSWRQNVYLFNFGILIIIAGAAISYIFFNMSYYTPILMTAFGLPVMKYTLGLVKENGETAAYKLRPVGYGFLMLTPLIITLGAVF